MATARVPPLSQVHRPRPPTTGSTRCRCQNVAVCEVHAAGAITHTTGTVCYHSKDPMSTRRTSTGIQRVPKKKRKPKSGASVTSTACIETHMDQIHLHSPKSPNDPLKPSKAVRPRELNTIPSEKREDVGSVQGRFCLLDQSKHQEVHCVGQGHCDRALREDFVLFDEVPRHQSTSELLKKGAHCRENEDEAIESFESADRTEWSLEDTPHLRLPPQPRQSRLPTPDLDDEIPLTFFPSLTTVGDQRQKRPGTDRWEDAMPLLIPLCDSALGQPQSRKGKKLRSFQDQRPPRLFRPAGGSIHWFA
ncbi:MAG: hypothetical protein Q9195_003524 [Heterodermia aff. obscurata]